MAKVRLTQTGMHVPWHKGEIITVQVTTELGDGLYECESIETYPENVKDQHRAELAARDASHATVVADLHRAHAAQLERMTATATPAPPASPADAVVVSRGQSEQHQKDLAAHLARGKEAT